MHMFGIMILGRLGIVDHDVVELNNMHRQVPFCPFGLFNCGLNIISSHGEVFNAKLLML